MTDNQLINAKIIVCGGRDFNDYNLFKNSMDKILEYFKNHKYTNITFVSGHAKGADLCAEQYAYENNINIKVFPADWNKYGKSAGIIRNRVMLDYIIDDSNAMPFVVAFWDLKSRGTGNMIEQAMIAHVGYQIITYNYNKNIDIKYRNNETEVKEGTINE